MCETVKLSQSICYLQYPQRVPPSNTKPLGTAPYRRSADNFQWPITTGGRPLVRTSRLLHRWREAGPLSSLVPGSTLTLNLWTEERRGMKKGLCACVPFSYKVNNLQTTKKALITYNKYKQTHTHKCMNTCCVNDDLAVLLALLAAICHHSVSTDGTYTVPRSVSASPSLYSTLYSAIYSIQECIYTYIHTVCMYVCMALQYNMRLKSSTWVQFPNM